MDGPYWSYVRILTWWQVLFANMLPLFFFFLVWACCLLCQYTTMGRQMIVRSSWGGRPETLPWYHQQQDSFGVGWIGIYIHKAAFIPPASTKWELSTGLLPRLNPLTCPCIRRHPDCFSEVGLLSVAALVHCGLFLACSMISPLRSVLSWTSVGVGAGSLLWPSSWWVFSLMACLFSL